MRAGPWMPWFTTPPHRGRTGAGPWAVTVLSFIRHLATYPIPRLGKPPLKHWNTRMTTSVRPFWRIGLDERLRQRLGGRWYQVPAGRIVMCPDCGKTDFPRQAYNLASFLCDGLNRVLSRRHPYWLYVLLERD